MKILILGRHECLFETARHLAEQTDHQIVAVVTAKAMPEYRKNEQDFEQLAQTCQAKFYLTQEIDETVDAIIHKTQPDIAVSLNWVSIVQESLTQKLPYGVLNAHFGNLPHYRGNAVTNWALIREEKQIMLTVHQMEPAGLDSGDILLQKAFPLRLDTTIQDINRFAEENIPCMFAQVLDGIERHELVPRRQANTGLAAFRCYPRLPRDGKIDWALPARKIHALIRSLVKPYSGAYTYFRTPQGALEKLYIWQSRLVCEQTPDIGVPGHVIRNDETSGESWIYTGDGIVALQAVSYGEKGPVFSPGNTWKSIRLRLGLDAEEELFQWIRTREDRPS